MSKPLAFGDVLRLKNTGSAHAEARIIFIKRVVKGSTYFYGMVLKAASSGGWAKLDVGHSLSYMYGADWEVDPEWPK